MKLTFIGGGNMGEAILAALLEKKLAVPADVCISDVSEPRRQHLKKQYGVAVTASNREAVGEKDAVILAVKPQNLPEVLVDLKGCLQQAQLVLSIVAGVKIDTISRGLSHNRIVRVMPNTPARIGLGFSGWTATPAVTAAQKRMAQSILGTMGREIYFDEEKYLDMVTAVSGSGPAYFFLFTECLIDAAVNIGLSQKNAEEMVLQTMLGSAHLIQNSGQPPAELRRNVAAKGGTTERAINVFEKASFSHIVADAVRAAYERARELGK
jgi:pyrroline-5-carboxylate reductase